MKYGFRVVYGDQEKLTQADYGKVAHLPCIFDSRPGYHRLASQFLIDRGVGLWDPRWRGSNESIIPPTFISMKNIADRLANFLEWCEARSIDPLAVDYKRDLIGRYQTEMLKGIWSRDAVSLAARTVNARVESACEFLNWTSDKGLRETLFIPKTVKKIKGNCSTSSVGHLSQEIEMRKGKVREPKRRLGLPADKEIKEWLQRIYEHKGLTEGLMCEAILETAVRREEMACWRVDTLPLDPSQWKITNPGSDPDHQAVLVDIVFGAKGKEYGRDHGDKIGPEGSIRVPFWLAHKLNDYRNKVRPKALALAIRQGKTRSEQERIRADAVHLFLNPITGQRYTGQNIYDIWRSVERPRGWSPHLARNFWACSILWMRIQQQKQLLEYALKTKIDDITLDALQSNALAVIQFEIQPQLRHASHQTTMIYLQWLSDRLGVNMNLTKRYEQELEYAIEEGDNK